MGLLGLYALDFLIDHGVDSIPSALKNKLKSAVAAKLDTKQASHKRELAKYGKVFSDYNKTAAALQNANAAYNMAYLKEQLADTSSPLDSETSETFANELIEVGHSGLCLSIDDGRVKQDSCADGAGERWTTTPAAGTSYFYIIGHTGDDCMAAEGKWVTVGQKFSDPKLPKAGSFTFEKSVFQGDGKITVSKCENLKEYHWKVLKHGDGWMQMANLATSQCLHFSNSSAVPGHAQAEWKPCVGSANQVYRIADSASPKMYKANIALKNDTQSACFAGPNAAGQIKMVDCTKAARYDYAIDIRGYIRFINTTTGNCLQPDGDTLESNLVERECTQLDNQWWDPIAVPGGWRIQNVQNKKCTDAPPVNFQVKMNNCVGYSLTVIAPIIDPNSGIIFKWKAPGERPPHYNATYPGTLNFGICSMGGIAGASWLPGSLDVIGNCYVASDNTQYINGGKRQRYITSIDGVEWVASGGGKIPVYAIPTGFRQGEKWGGWPGAKTVYLCRTRTFTSYDGSTGEYLPRGEIQRLTVFGWTIDGEICNFAIYLAVETLHTFEVLARRKDKSYELKLDAFWPVPKPGVWYPGLPHVLAKKK